MRPPSSNCLSLYFIRKINTTPTVSETIRWTERKIMGIRLTGQKASKVWHPWKKWKEVLTWARLDRASLLPLVSWHLAGPHQEEPELCFALLAPRAACAVVVGSCFKGCLTVALISLTDRRHWKQVKGIRKQLAGEANKSSSHLLGLAFSLKVDWSQWGNR